MLGSIQKLVGGTHDGNTLNISTRDDTILIPENLVSRPPPIAGPDGTVPDKSVTMSAERYQRMWFICDRTRVSLFAREGLSSLDVMLKLGYHYHPPQNVYPEDNAEFRQLVYRTLYEFEGTTRKAPTALYFGFKQKSHFKAMVLAHYHMMKPKAKPADITLRGRDEFCGIQIFYVDTNDHLACS